MKLTKRQEQAVAHQIMQKVADKKRNLMAEFEASYIPTEDEQALIDANIIYDNAYKAYLLAKEKVMGTANTRYDHYSQIQYTKESFARQAALDKFYKMSVDEGNIIDQLELSSISPEFDIETFITEYVAKFN